jgi:hypothetical protein
MLQLLPAPSSTATFTFNELLTGDMPIGQPVLTRSCTFSTRASRPSPWVYLAHGVLVATGLHAASAMTPC